MAIAKARKLKGKAFEYQVGEYHLHITFLEENQLRWKYLAAPGGMTGKTATETIERVQLRQNQFLMMWKEADGTQVVDVVDLGKMMMYANFVLANGERFSAQAELIAVE